MADVGWWSNPSFLEALGEGVEHFMFQLPSPTQLAKNTSFEVSNLVSMALWEGLHNMIREMGTKGGNPENHLQADEELKLILRKEELLVIVG